MRLTGNSAYNTRPLISPNGRWVTFTGDYRGNSSKYSAIRYIVNALSDIRLRAITLKELSCKTPAPAVFALFWYVVF